MILSLLILDVLAVQTSLLAMLRLVAVGEYVVLADQFPSSVLAPLPSPLP